MLRVLMYSSHLDGAWAYLIASLAGKVEYVLHLEHQQHWDWDKKIRYHYEYCSSHPDDLIIGVDTWDTLFIGDPDELESILSRLPMAIAPSSRRCWPEGEKASLHPEVPSPWRFVNGAGLAGKGSLIAEAIRYGLDHFPVRPRDMRYHLLDVAHNDIDQRFYTDLYLAGKVMLDYRCEITQQLNLVEPGELGYKDGRIHNLITGSRPQFIHAAHRTWDLIPKEIVNAAIGRIENDSR